MSRGWPRQLSANHNGLEISQRVFIGCSYQDDWADSSVRFVRQTYLLLNRVVVADGKRLPILRDPMRSRSWTDRRRTLDESIAYHVSAGLSLFTREKEFEIYRPISSPC